MDVLDLLEICRKRGRLILGMTAICGALGFIVGAIQPPRYVASFSLRMGAITTLEKATLISPGEVEKVVGQLDGLARSGRAPELSRVLGIEESVAAQATRLRARARFLEGIFAEITVETTEPKSIHPMHVAVMDHLNRLPYVQKRVQSKRENLQAIREDYLKKIDAWTELERIFRARMKESSRSPRDSEIGLALLLAGTDMADVRRKLAEIDLELATAKGFEVVVAPETPAVPRKPDRMLLAVGGLAAGALFSVMIALGLELRRSRRPGKART